MDGGSEQNGNIDVEDLSVAGAEWKETNDAFSVVGQSQPLTDNSRRP